MARNRNATPRRPARRAARTLESRLLSKMKIGHPGLSYAELGERMGLSKTPTWARVRALEQAGAITGYRAELEPAALSTLTVLHAFVEVRLRPAQHADLEAAVLRHPAVLECYATTARRIARAGHRHRRPRYAAARRDLAAPGVGQTPTSTDAA